MLSKAITFVYLPYCETKGQYREDKNPTSLMKISHLNIIGSAGNALGHCLDSSGSSERFLDDEGGTAADTVLGDHPEVVRRVLLQTPDLERRHRRRADLLPRLLADLATLDDV